AVVVVGGMTWAVRILRQLTGQALVPAASTSETSAAESAGSTARVTALAERERQAEQERHRLAEREQKISAAETDLARRRAALTAREAALADALATAAAERQRELARIAGLTPEAARAELLAELEADAKREAAVLVRRIEGEARRTAEERARAIVVEAIQRVASDQTTESTVSVLHLPSDEMKGRIIGREGRNIRAFESVTGVNLLVDETPAAVVLSCFDPVRRETARMTM